MKKKLIMISFILLGVLSFHSTTIYAQEDRIYTDHETYIENGKEYSLEGLFIRDVNETLIPNEDLLDPEKEMSEDPEVDPNPELDEEQEINPEMEVEPEVPSDPQTEVPEVEDTEPENQVIPDIPDEVPPIEEELPETPSEKPENPETGESVVPEEKPIDPTTPEIKPIEPVNDPQLSVPEQKPEQPNVSKPVVESKVEEMVLEEEITKKEPIVENKGAVIKQPTITASLLQSYINPYPSKGVIGSLKKALRFDYLLLNDISEFVMYGNPFTYGQCTWFAWARFYQIYGFDSLARGHGMFNAYEIAKKHSDKFELSSTPSAGSVFSMQRNTLYPQYGHVGFVEAYDGEYMWISEGNVTVGNTDGNVRIYKVRFEDFKAMYPDVVFAVPKKVEKTKIEKRKFKKMNIEMIEKIEFENTNFGPNRGSIILMKM